MRTPQRRVTGFNLVEALIVLLVLVVLAAFLMPLFRPRDGCTSITQCMPNQKQIALAVTMYAVENDETMPGLASERGVNTSHTWRTAIGVADKVYNCTSAGRDGSTTMPLTATRGPEIGMNTALYAVGLGVLFSPETTILTADANCNGIVSPTGFDSRHNEKKGLAASFCDGHVEYIITANLPKAPRHVGNATPALARSGMATATHYLDPQTDFSPYLLSGASGRLLTLQDRTDSTALARLILPTRDPLLRRETIVIKMGNQSSEKAPESWSVGPVTLLDYYHGKPTPKAAPILRYGLAAGDYRVGSYAVIKP
ncbi:MAG TPA: hypothetical protein VGL77_00405 [Armatimonadota bacterium]|jgi:prepilin-type processing-associated H-X9-DG protein